MRVHLPPRDQLPRMRSQTALTLCYRQYELRRCAMCARITLYACYLKYGWCSSVPFSLVGWCVDCNWLHTLCGVRRRDRLTGLCVSSATGATTSTREKDLQLGDCGARANSSEDNSRDSHKGDSNADSSAGITVALLVVGGALVCMLVAGVVYRARKPSAGEQQAGGADHRVVYSNTSNAAFEMPSDPTYAEIGDALGTRAKNEDSAYEAFSGERESWHNALQVNRPRVLVPVDTSQCYTCMRHAYVWSCS